MRVLKGRGKSIKHTSCAESCRNTAIGIAIFDKKKRKKAHLSVNEKKTGASLIGEGMKG